MRGWAAAVLLLLAAGPAAGQSVPAYQMGTVQPNDLAKYIRNGQIRDAAGIAGDNNGVGVNPFSITDYGQLGLCSDSQPTSKPYSSLCLGHDSSGAGVISLFSMNGEPARAMKFVIDGVAQTPTFGGPYLPLIGGTIAGTAPGNVVVNRNPQPTLPNPPGIGTPLFWGVGNTGETPMILLDAVAGAPIVIMRRANGSGAGAMVSGDVIARFAGRGYGATGYTGSSNARMDFVAVENFSDTAQGAKIDFQTIAPGSATLLSQAVIGPGLSVGTPTAPPGGMGYGDVNAQRVMVQGQVVATGGPFLPLAGGIITGSAPGSLTINRNPAVPPPPLPVDGTPVFWAVGNANELPLMLTDAINSSGILTFRRANGAGSTAIVAGDVLGLITARGYGSTAYATSANARIEFDALQNFTDTQQGTQIKFSTMPRDSITRVIQAVVGPGILVGAAPPPGDGMRTGDVNAQRMMINGVPVISGTGGTMSGSLIINHAPTMPAAPVGSTYPLFWGVGAGSETPLMVLDSIGANGTFMLRRANGTGTTPVAAGDILGHVAARGYGTTGYGGAVVRLEFNALENFTDTQQGTQIKLVTVPVGTTSQQTQATIGPGLTVGTPPAPPPGWPQAGDINTQRLAAGELVLVKSGTPAAVGTNFGKLILTAGTTAGTCKLLVYAGTSTTPTTLADNIGSGC